MTNYEKICAMSDEELAKLLKLAYFCPNDIGECPIDVRCLECINNWLKQEAEP